MYLQVCTVQLYRHIIHADARWMSHGDSVGDSVGVVQTCIHRCVHTVQLYTHVHGHIHVYTVQLYAHTWTYACTMYIYMQVLNGCLTENWCPAVSVYIYMYLQVCTVQLYAHTWTYACTMYMYIVYMQVLNGCLAASNRQNWCPAVSVYIYMYLQVCTVQLYAHTWTYACTMYMYIVYMQVLNGCLAASNRQNWCPAASVYIYMYLQVCTVQLCAHT